MSTRAFIIALSSAASFALLPAGAQAFEIQGEDSDVPKSAAEYHGLDPVYTMPQFEGSSLAMPFANDSDSGGFVSNYGNDIAIPAPGISQPTPAWRSGPFFR